MATIKVKNSEGKWEAVASARVSDEDFTGMVAYEQGIEQGKQAEYDAFWDAYQQNGTRIDYGGGFAGRGWNKDTFKPKYNIAPSGSYGGRYMFFNFNLSTYSPKVEDLLDFTEFNDMFDFSGLTYFLSTFENAQIKNLYVDASNATNMTNAFMASNGGMIENLTLKVSEKCTTFSACFSYQRNTKEIHFTDDSVIAASIAFTQSTRLSKESIISIINALSTTTSGLTVTISKTAVNKAFETSEGANDGSTSADWIKLAGNDNQDGERPNWTITLV